MEVKYPKLKKGLNLIYISIWIKIFGKIPQRGFNCAAAALGQSLDLDWIAGIVGVVGEGLSLPMSSCSVGRRRSS